MHAGRSGRAARAVGVLLSVTLLLGLAEAPALATRALRRQMTAATNESRTRHGRSRLDVAWRMTKVARRHSLRMARAGHLFHTSNVQTYLHGHRWSAWGENVGETNASVPWLQRAFMRSTEHRLNILNKGFHHVAVGAVRRRGRLWVTVFFYG